MDDALPTSPELILVSPPEVAARARRLLADVPGAGLARTRPLATPETAAPPRARVRALDPLSVLVGLYSLGLTAACAFVVVAIVVHDVRFG